MSKSIDHDRRRLLGAAALGMAAGLTIGPAPALAQGAAPGVAPGRALPPGFGPLSQVKAGVLDIGYAKAGPSSGPPVVLLHGWPYDIHTYVEVAPLLAAGGYRVIVPYLRGYGTTRFLSDETVRNGQQAALAVFARLIWQLASPKWKFDDLTFARSAAAFDNPYHVSIVIHNYRWRLGLAEGEREYDDLEKRLAEFPVITVPTITLKGDANRARHPDPAAYARKFSARYEHRQIEGGRHRAQPAAGSAAGIRRSRHRYSRGLIDGSRRHEKKASTTRAITQRIAHRTTSRGGKS